MDFKSNFVLIFVVINVLVNIQECFCRIITLNCENFEEHVFNDHTPWIIAMKERVSEEVLQEMNEEIKDRIDIGIIDEKKLETTMKKIVSNS